MPAEPAAPRTEAPAFRPANPVVIGLLGGVASGKSVVAELFTAHGLRHIDADAISRAVSAEPEVVREVAAAFGPGVVAGDGLDRRALAAIVFDDPAARRRLEAVLHPRIRARVLAELAAARAAGASVVLDAPLLLENGLIALCDHVVFVDAAPAVRAERARARGWAAGELERREAAQAPLMTKRDRAGHCLQNDHSLAETQHQVAALLQQLATGPA